MHINILFLCRFAADHIWQINTMNRMLLQTKNPPTLRIAQDIMTMIKNSEFLDTYIISLYLSLKLFLGFPCSCFIVSDMSTLSDIAIGYWTLSQQNVKLPEVMSIVIAWVSVFNLIPTIR